MKIIARILGLVAIIGLVATLSACNDEVKAQPAKTAQAQKAAEAANSIVFKENAEIDNIKKRLELTADPGMLGYIVLMNEAGQPIIYEGVKGKVTSGGKRLTAPEELKRLDAGQTWAWEVVKAPSDEGTHGSSSPYIFYWNTDGTYRQWSGHYLYSDKPIRLRVEPLVINLPPQAAAAVAPNTGK